jgi:6-phosphogluconolactonase (cycloisomerase 2 family)
MTDIPSRYITVVSLPPVTAEEAIIASTRWFQEYAPLTAPKELTGTIHFIRDTLTAPKERDSLLFPQRTGSIHSQIDFAFLGRKDEFMRTVYPEMARGLGGVLNETALEGSVREGSLLDAVLQWTASPSLSDLIGSFSLPPLSRRSRRRCKGSSLLAFAAVSDVGIRSILDSMRTGDITHAQFKAYGGRNVLHPYSVWDSRSPLRRGHRMEIHFSACYKTSSRSVDERKSRDRIAAKLQLASMDQELVKSFSNAIQRISETFPDVYPYSFPAYVDVRLPDPGRSYYGAYNARKLSNIRSAYGPASLRTRAGFALYPIRHSYVFIGCGSNKISTYSLNHDTGTLSFVSQVEASHPSWLSVSARGDTLYAVSRHAKSSAGSIVAYQIQSSGTLVKLLDCVTSGKGPTHIAATPFQSHLYVSHGGGNISVVTRASHSLTLHQSLSPNLYTSLLSLDDDFIDPVSRIQMNARPLAVPHPFIHQVVPDPHSNLVLAADLYRDCLYVLRRDSSTGRLSLLYSYLLPVHTGPRHLVFHPLHSIVFVVGETSNTVTTLTIHRDSGVKRQSEAFLSLVSDPIISREIESITCDADS